MHTGYILDTNVLSQSSKRERDEIVCAWMATVRNASIPMGALIEFAQGIAMARSRNPIRAAELQDWLDGLLATDITLVQTNKDIALLYGEMRVCGPLKHLWQSNPSMAVPRGGNDMYIAAAAIITERYVATLDVADFLSIHEHFPLPGLYNPREDKWHVSPGKPKAA